MYWSPVIEGAVTLLFIWLMPKRLTRLEVYATWMVMIALTLCMDVLGALTFHFYDVATPKSDWAVLVIDLLFPPAAGVAYLNFMPRSLRGFILYLVFIVVPLSIFLEWIDLHFGYFTYHHWNLWYSAIIYLFGMSFLRWHLYFIRSQVSALFHRRERHSERP